MMKKPRFSIAHKDDEMVKLVRRTDHKTMARWAIACANRVMPSGVVGRDSEVILQIQFLFGIYNIFLLCPTSPCIGNTVRHGP